MKKTPRLAIIVPCYNEEDALPYCINTLSQIITNLDNQSLIASNSFIFFVDDGSSDATWSIIENAALESHVVKGMKLSMNKGHQIALIAGLENANADINISIDADLQDDPSAIEQMVHEFWHGYEIVYGVRNDRKTDSFWKRKTAGIFYQMMALLGVHQISQHADFRLLSRRATDALLSFNEQNLYLRGLITLIGFKSTKVYYSRIARCAGNSKYSFKQMVALAIEGITSFTVTPLRVIAGIGFTICVLFFIAAVYAIIQKLNGHTIEGWTSIMIAIFFLGGVQIFFLGVIGEYIGKIYFESKNRPKYFVEKKIGGSDEN